MCNIWDIFILKGIFVVYWINLTGWAVFLSGNSTSKARKNNLILW